MKEFNYFSSPIYREERPDWVQKTLGGVNKYYDEVKNNCQSNVVIQTANMQSDPKLKFLKDHFLKTSVAILKSQGYIVENYDFFVPAMWAQNIECNGGNIRHVHSNAQMVGFYFMETPENSSYPVFSDPRPAKEMADLDVEQSFEVRHGTKEIHFNNLMPGTFLYSNAWLPHQFIPNYSKKPTKFVHFILEAARKNNI